jgi:hypothetical protein
MSFATELEKHVARLGIAESCAALDVTRRTLEQWRAGREPRQIVQRGALVILSETRPKTKKAAPGGSNDLISHARTADENPNPPRKSGS